MSYVILFDSIRTGMARSNCWVGGLTPVVMPHIGHDQIGSTLMKHFFSRWERSGEDGLPRVLVRTAATNGEAAARIQAILTDQATVMVATVAGSDRARERACLIVTQIRGLAYARHVLAVSNRDPAPEPARMMIDDTLQRYLFSDLP